ncbi:carbohydrate sulfotransferase 11 [Orussus abietinus]|uniref:carbohydrate sulfotransferase 11 n=1 Tax=Orussus abietinus TaxID=222816 RepID=UPI0006264975|nr:carbohydrate sulfotransferase 11 [Orussus abietinus]XP_012275010.1 carbohydrate sulfotransferase 11 [Orussus abietinus]
MTNISRMSKLAFKICVVVNFLVIYKVSSVSNETSELWDVQESPKSSTVYSQLKHNALVRAIFVQRQERLLVECSKIVDNGSCDTSIKPEMLHHILVDEKHKLLYCFVPKVACTNWKRVLMVAREKTTQKDPLLIPANLVHSSNMFRSLNTYALADIKQMLSTYNKLIVARHPLERLLSAYRNKFEVKNKQSSNYFQIHIGKRIIKKYRRQATKESLSTGNDVTFQEFVQFVTDTAENSTLNEHWKPISELCHPCAIKYNFISKYETLADDALEILERMGTDWITFPPRPRNSEPTSKKLCAYYPKLKYEQLRKLSDIYKLDLRLFDYSLEDIFGFSLA